MNHEPERYPGELLELRENRKQLVRFAEELAIHKGTVPEKLRCEAELVLRKHAPRETYGRLADEVRERREPQG